MMANTTKGLPLAIVRLANILVREEQSLRRWEHIADGIEREISEIFGRGYWDLPKQLKACFLYFAAFPKDYQIPVRKLIRLWIAEGLVPSVESKSLEDTAQDFLMELIHRSLVIVSERRSMGGSKTCRLLDLIQKFCLAKAEEQNFLEQIGWDWPSASSWVYLSTDRLSFCYGGKVEDFSVFPTNPFLGSLLCFQFGYWSSRRLINCFSSYISGLKGVKVLELDEVFIDESFFSIQLPVHLTYLSVNGAIHSIPPSIADLLNMETLIVKGDESTIQVPESIWTMKKLRHLRIDNRASFKLPDSISWKNSITLDNLEVLSCPVLCHGENADKILQALPRLQKLKCSIVQKRAMECSSDIDPYPQLGCLAELESLRVRYCGFLGNSSSEFNLPLTLKKLTLVHLPWNNISTLGRLPNLVVLKILSGSFEEDWCMEGDVSFLNLRVLKLCRLRIKQWDASEDNFPCLEQLVVERCEKLESIPSCFGWIPTLQLIDVKWCSLSLATSVEQIREEQMELANEELKVYISTDGLPQSFGNRSFN